MQRASCAAAAPPGPAAAPIRGAAAGAVGRRAHQSMRGEAATAARSAASHVAWRGDPRRAHSARRESVGSAEAGYAVPSVGAHPLSETTTTNGGEEMLRWAQVPQQAESRSDESSRPRAVLAAAAARQLQLVLDRSVIESSATTCRRP